ncbi:MAG: hypothetical protein BWY43_00254 [candidate division WS2 bacterium ADurb.Bin280]|uniref:Uncharacterized protein n=1 Tax=candidate division WS2 bacterium ADurb.Bin280 TaxID=1852829 RepID=A0A1V5SEL3_9BACT|nr:MAG: hypothetical protein BWY43_00254 [candidate division WS2 bacterium ADurb.Bin280]
MRKGGVAPKGLNLAVYLLVGIAFVVFVISIIYGTIEAKDTALTSLGLKIEASSKSASCKEGEVLYGINNYPHSTTPTEKGSHSKYTDKMPSGTWKCSAICGPSDPEKFAKDFLPSLKSQNEKLNIVANKNEFDALVARINSKDEILERTVILQSSLARKGKGCFGPSEDYKTLTGATLTKENTTAADQKKAEEERKAQLAKQAKERQAQAKKTSSSSSSNPSSNTAAGSPDEQALVAPASNGSGNIEDSSNDEEDILSGDKDKVSVVGPCWLEFNEAAVAHMRKHLGKYDLHGDTKMRKERIIRDIKTELGGGWVYKDAKGQIRTIPASENLPKDEKNQNTLYSELTGLHGNGGKDLAKKIGEYYGEYRDYAKNPKNVKDPEKEKQMLKRCEEVRERIEKANTGREDVESLQKKHNQIVELLKKIKEANTGYFKIESANGFLGFENPETQYNNIALLNYLKDQFKSSYILEDKILLRGFYGINNVKKFNKQADEILEELNEFVDKRPFVKNENKNVTIKFSGYIATSQESIKSNGEIKNGSAPIHVCVYLFTPKEGYDHRYGCKKTIARKTDGFFEVIFEVTPERYAEIRSQAKVFKLYAEYNSTWGAVRNIYESVTVDHDPRAYSGDGKRIYYSIKRKKELPFILKGDPHFGPINGIIKMSRRAFMDKPLYQVAEKNMVVETSKQFMRDTVSSKKCYER